MIQRVPAGRVDKRRPVPVVLADLRGPRDDFDKERPQLVVASADALAALT